ncbi:MAG: DUF1998 domain-containing protein, partial [Chloroflexi bacterium]|nr:DUF1998 domain-containing protein [Chloroflexota bacterium]
MILPVGEDEELPTRRVKQCSACGYLHPITGGDGLDLCERCGSELGAPLTQLFRMQNVSAKRRDRITSDEEERQRFGYELRTGVRFAEHGGRPAYRTATVEREGVALARLTYGHAATLWRINLGWRRRKNQDQVGFLLDTERGYWEKNQAVPDEDADPMSPKAARVIPFVDDRRNCLLLEPDPKILEQLYRSLQPLLTRPGTPGGSNAVREQIMASLQAALKSAIQAEFQLEDNELAAEPLPDPNQRRLILLYESAEGGAGVLRQLLDDPESLARVAKEALRICHFAPETGADLGYGPRAREVCTAACYDCLMSYYNQRDHALL